MLCVNKKNLCPLCFSQIFPSEKSCRFCNGVGNNKKYSTAIKEGTILAGKYSVGKVLGKGGFGITYLCYDINADKTVAIKEYLPDTLAHRNTGETSVTSQGEANADFFKNGAIKFFDEAKLLSKFNGNPNIINVHEFFYENGTAYFVMEYLDGTDLKNYLSSKDKISENEAMYILSKVSDALMIVHSAGVLHRDISPDNIFICSNGDIKIIDFGAARQVLGEVSKSLSVILKQGFAPLEQYQKKGAQGPWTDIYALGATIYYALTGKMIDDAMTRLENDYLDYSQIPPELEYVLKKMLAVKHADRYQSIFGLKNDIGKIQITPVAPVCERRQPEPLQSYPIAENREFSLKEFILKHIKPIAITTASVFFVVSVLVTYLILNNLSDKDKKHFPAGIVTDNTVTPEVVTFDYELRHHGKILYDNVSCGNNNNFFLLKNGTVKITGPCSESLNQATKWKYLIDITAGRNFVAGLDADNNVYAAGDNSYGQCNVEGWNNIIRLSAGNNHLIAMRSDGTCFAVGANDGYVYQNANGTMISNPDSSGQCDISGWSGKIEIIEAGGYHTAGVDSFGNVVAVGDNDFGQCDVNGWTDIVNIDLGELTTVGIKSDRTVVAVGYNDFGQCNVQGWTDIVDISAGKNHTVGIRSDGTVVATGSNEYGQCNVYDWTNISTVYAGKNYTIGVKNDGTIITAGSNESGMCDVESITNVAVKATLIYEHEYSRSPNEIPRDGIMYGFEIQDGDIPGIPAGIYVVMIDAKSNMALSGLSKGDILTSLNGISISKISEMNEMISKMTAGDAITATYYRPTDKCEYQIQFNLNSLNHIIKF